MKAHVQGGSMQGTIFTYPAVEEIQLVFFAAMREGWVKNPNLGPPLPSGERVIEHNDGTFYLVRDSFFTLPGKSYVSGATTIWYKGRPVWRMSYQGQYQEEALPILREVLAYTYGNDIFVGCRGVENCQHQTWGQGWKYTNRHKGVFGEFRGREEITRWDELTHGGWHEYFGILLF